jgi:membrane protein YqaA with SNARE-associated domain
MSGSKEYLMGHLGLISALVVSSIRHWLFRLGGLGLILVALIDNSFIPIPGGLDVFTILLSARQHQLWPYYAIVATVGSVIGAYLTYKIGLQGGKETLEKKIGQRRAERVYKKVENAGFTSVFVGVLIPPPFPAVPVLLAAGALQIPRRKFLLAVAAGRAIRYTIDALLGVYYGHAIIRFFAQYYQPALYFLIGLGIAGGIGLLVSLKWWRPRHQHDQQQNETRQPDQEKVA